MLDPESLVIKDSSLNPDLPDVAETRAVGAAGPIDWVGMEEMELPLLDHEGGQGPVRVSARVAAFVSLDRGDQRGIHMSRLYTLLRDRLASEALNLRFLRQVLDEMIASQEPLSENARLELKFEKWRRRSALKSAEWGWRRYPFEVLLEKTALGARAELAFEILYSSTCPASAALARHDLVERLHETFGSSRWNPQQVTEWLQAHSAATPHAQRSRATIRLEVLSEALLPDWGEFIDRAESALGTPVQTAVRREDEQEFARLNGQNLLFCEDAVRRLAQVFKSDQRIKSFQLRVEHLESLHPHNAVASLSWPPAN
ncbi:MAG: GTP cyclohydrolase I FolE2 [Bdellovibrionales bacterium]|nr:GTP cyclohydrolase I FolE2 [Bdellovibrionales bacterium]